ncbi:hypothetical protein AGOR_G00247340 [Albula goreensis]|uniref:Telomeric repeat-binding factor n=1 Tax=Albula goreensis TaxID=1534307 RepID=A0A8T3CB04_9TELE|nr:hypothetical protein AGOR_G00247340 [Albula goreensis]
MAESERVLVTRRQLNEISNNSERLDSVINRWCVDYYTFSALNAFKDGLYTEFCQIRDILQSLVVRPLEHSENLSRKIRVLQFLARINDGDKLDYTFDSQDSSTPLESALSVLDSISQELDIPQQDLRRVQKSIYEMLVIICIKNNEFAKAEEVLKKYFPKSSTGKKAVFMSLVQKKSASHPSLEQVTYEQFRTEMLHFSECLFTNSDPFLYKTAVKLAAKRLEIEEPRTPGQQPAPEDVSPVQPQPSESSEPSESAAISVPSGRAGGVQVRWSLLKDAYKALAEELGTSHAFAELEEAAQREAQCENAEGDCASSSRPDSPIPSASSRPRAGPRAKEVRPCTVTRLVIEEDSQRSEVESLASQEEPTAVPEKPAASPAKTTDGRESPMSPLCSPSAPYRRPRKRPLSNTQIRRIVDSDDDSSDGSKTPNGLHFRGDPQPSTSSRTLSKLLSTNHEEKDDWSDEDSLFGTSASTVFRRRNGGLKKMWTAEETEWVRQGVAKYGEGNWAKIKNSFPFKGRTSVNIKDKWRTLKKQKL